MLSTLSHSQSGTESTVDNLMKTGYRHSFFAAVEPDIFPTWLDEVNSNHIMLSIPEIDPYFNHFNNRI